MTGPHPELAEISALHEKLLPADEATTVHAHIETCPPCSATWADLAILRQELATLSGPDRMPDDVAARIDAALVAEVSVSRETPVRRGRRWSLFSLAAAGAAVALGTASLLTHALPETATEQEASSFAAREGDRDALTGGAGGGVDPLEDQVHELLASTADPDGSETAEEDSSAPGDDEPAEEDTPWAEEYTTQGAPESTPLSDPEAPLPSCVRAAIDRNEPPLAAGEEDYRGKDTYLVVLPHASEPRWVDAYVIDARCSGNDPRGSGKILVHETYTRE